MYIGFLRKTDGEGTTHVSKFGKRETFKISTTSQWFSDETKRKT